MSVKPDSLTETSVERLACGPRTLIVAFLESLTFGFAARVSAVGFLAGKLLITLLIRPVLLSIDVPLGHSVPGIPSE